MEIAIVIILIVLGVIFFMLELFLLPGITVAGIFGGISTIAAIWYAYSQFGTTVGNITLLGGILLMVLAIYTFIKGKALEKMSLKTNISGKSNTIPAKIEIGDVGITLSRLAPMGKILVKGITLEAKSDGDFIDDSTNVVITKINSTNVLVELKNENS